MNQQFQYERLGGSRNPIAQIAGLIVGVLTLIGSLILGSIVLAVLIGLFLIFGIWVTVRVWWLRRQFEAAAREQRTDDRVIEAEYIVIRDSEKNRQGQHEPGQD